MTPNSGIRILPILAEDGEIVANASSIIIGYRHYPEEPLSADIVAFAISENERRNCPRSSVANRIESDLLNSATQAVIAGEVALALMEVFVYQGKASLNKAAYLVSEESYANSKPNIELSTLEEDGSSRITKMDVRISAHPTDIKKAFRRYKNSCHLLAASAILNREMDVRRFCSEAAAIQNFLIEKKLIQGWNPWRIPEELSVEALWVPANLSSERQAIVEQYKTGG